MKSKTMQLQNRTSLCRKLLIMALLCVGCIVSSVPAAAATKKAVAPGIACKSGRYIYYGNNYGGLFRYDTKTNKKKRITSTS